MIKIEAERLKILGGRLEKETQDSVMQDIEQFSQTEVVSGFAAGKPEKTGIMYPMVFNMERGTRLEATLEFLKKCPDIQPFDIIFANELDDGCERSKRVNVAEKVARELGMYYAYSLEFIELKDPHGGFHGNALFSKYPIEWAETLRLPEAYNWYFDRQKRIGGRCAVFAKINYFGQTIGVVSVHLENRTDGEGRRAQMRAVLYEASRVFNGIPVMIGGDLNTNTFDGRDKELIMKLVKNPDELDERLKSPELYEKLLADFDSEGYSWRINTTCGNETGQASPAKYFPTRRKVVPNRSPMQLCLDWLAVKGCEIKESRVISTLKKDCVFAVKGGALDSMTEDELSDHNVVWSAVSPVM